MPESFAREALLSQIEPIPNVAKEPKLRPEHPARLAPSGDQENAPVTVRSPTRFVTYC